MNKLKLVEELSPEEVMFNEFWSVYPRRESKKDAKKAFYRIKNLDKTFPEIMNGLKLRAAWWEQEGTEKQYMKLPATWLNGECWEDEIEIEDNERWNFDGF